MNIQSMTGFARVEASDERASWVWELRSVNGKTLDLRFRLPSGLDRLETSLKAAISQSIQRGNIQISLQYGESPRMPVPSLNREALDAAVAIVDEVAGRLGETSGRLEAVLGMRGVIEIEDKPEDEGDLAAHQQRLLQSFVDGVGELAAMRLNEGGKITEFLLAHVAEIDRLTTAVKADPSRSADAIRARLGEQVNRLMETGGGRFDEDRLYQEAAMLATRADLQEEIERLESHISAAGTLLQGDGAIGRKLDFLAQEFNRECNTICSKSNAAGVTRLGLEMKVVIDQFREQIQNIQ